MKYLRLLMISVLDTCQSPDFKRSDVITISLSVILFLLVAPKHFMLIFSKGKFSRIDRMFISLVSSNINVVGLVKR